jgi:hypothetical protein
MTASETQRQLDQALEAHKSDLEITRAAASVSIKRLILGLKPFGGS